MDVAFQLNDENSAEQVAVPEPAPLAAFTIGVIGVIALRRRRAA